MASQNGRIATWIPEKELFPPFRLLSVVKYPAGCEGSVSHRHDCFQTVFVLSGEFLFIDREGARHPLKRGELAVIPPGCVHNWGSRRGCRAIQVSADLMQPDSFGDLSWIFGLRDGSEWRKLSIPEKEFKAATAPLLRELEKSRPGDAALVHAGLISLFALAFRFKPDLGINFERAKDSGEDAVFSQAVKFMKENCQRSLSLEDLAGNACLGVSRYSEIFRRRAGCSPMKFFMRQKMQKAKSLLLYSDLSVSETAKSLGFSSIHYFSKAFKKLNGHAPSELSHDRNKEQSPEGVKTKTNGMNRKK